MAFNLAKLIQREGIPYQDHGPQVKRGNLYIKCPFCGDSDPSMHMGIDINDGKWACWRDARHRGKKPLRIVQKLLDIPWDQAKALIDGEQVVREATLDDLTNDLAALGGVQPEARAPIQAVEWPAEFKPLYPVEGAQRSYLYDSFRRYLSNPVDAGGRGFAPAILDNVCQRYQLHYASVGRFAQRLIVPFPFRRQMVGWTARAVGVAQQRYLSFPPGDIVKRILFNYDHAAEGGRVLNVVEGPFDTIKFDWHAHVRGVNTVGLLGASVTDLQVSLLLELADRHDEVWLMLDDDALGVSMDLQTRLAMASPKLIQLPEDFHDPGELTPIEVEMILNRELLTGSRYD